VTSTTGTYSDAYDASGSGWITYASLMLGLAGAFNVIDGIVAVSKSRFYVAGATFVAGDLNTWGWIVLVVGALQIAAAIYVTNGSEMARWFGVASASLSGIVQLLFLPAYPLWSIAVFAMDILIVYALVVYGGKRLKQYQ
jgi:hypothetical protein